MTANAHTYRAAADVIKRYGLAKQAYHSEDGYCTAGALRYVTGRVRAVEAPEIVELAKLIGGYHACQNPDCAGLGAHSNAFDVVTDWNDDPNTTPEDVIGLLEQAANEMETRS